MARGHSRERAQEREQARRRRLAWRVMLAACVGLPLGLTARVEGPRGVEAPVVAFSGGMADLREEDGELLARVAFDAYSGYHEAWFAAAEAGLADSELNARLLDTVSGPMRESVQQTITDLRDVGFSSSGQTQIAHFAMTRAYDAGDSVVHLEVEMCTDPGDFAPIIDGKPAPPESRMSAAWDLVIKILGSSVVEPVASVERMSSQAVLGC